MALLLNRKYGSRLECLYYILKAQYAKYGTASAFDLSNFKYDPDDLDNVHAYCELLQDVLGMPCCPYLKNPLDLSKCYATQSVDSDTTKSKAVSDIGGSLEALGFITRIAGRSQYKISSLGEEWVNSDFYSSEWEDIAREGVLSYGPIIGLINILKSFPRQFSYSSIYLGYPQTEEEVEYVDAAGNGYTVYISTGSERDSVTRTKSHIIGWCVSVGLVEPIGTPCDQSSPLAHLKYREFLNAERLTASRFKKTELCENLLSRKIHVKNTLAYSRLHKDVKALRENGGEILRRATMLYNSKIINRRFVFIYVLNYFSELNMDISFDSLIDIMCDYYEDFFTPNNNPYAIMATESEIANLAGIPFDEVDGYLHPLTTIDKDILCEDVPITVKKLADAIVIRMRNS